MEGDLLGDLGVPSEQQPQGAQAPPPLTIDFSIPLEPMQTGGDLVDFSGEMVVHNSDNLVAPAAGAQDEGEEVDLLASVPHSPQPTDLANMIPVDLNTLTPHSLNSFNFALKEDPFGGSVPRGGPLPISSELTEEPLAPSAVDAAEAASTPTPTPASAPTAATSVSGPPTPSHTTSGNASFNLGDSSQPSSLTSGGLHDTFVSVNVSLLPDTFGNTTQHPTALAHSSHDSLTGSDLLNLEAHDSNAAQQQQGGSDQQAQQEGQGQGQQQQQQEEERGNVGSGEYLEVGAQTAEGDSDEPMPRRESQPDNISVDLLSVDSASLAAAPSMPVHMERQVSSVDPVRVHDALLSLEEPCVVGGGDTLESAPLLDDSVIVSALQENPDHLEHIMAARTITEPPSPPEMEETSVTFHQPAHEHEQPHTRHGNGERADDYDGGVAMNHDGNMTMQNPPLPQDLDMSMLVSGRATGDDGETTPHESVPFSTTHTPLEPLSPPAEVETAHGGAERVEMESVASLEAPMDATLVAQPHDSMLVSHTHEVMMSAPALEESFIMPPSLEIPDDIPPVPFSPQAEKPIEQVSESDPTSKMLFESLSPAEKDEIHRRHAVWPIKPAVKAVLAERRESAARANFGTIVVDKPPADKVAELARQHGVDSLRRRTTSFIDGPGFDLSTIRFLIKEGSWHSALEVTTAYLKGSASGADPQLPHKQLQMWFTRIAILMKLKMFTEASSEMESLGDLDRPEMFFEFYTDVYAQRKGSMVPFSLRVLQAELPSHLKHHRDALDKLYALLAVCKTIQKRVRNHNKELEDSAVLGEAEKEAVLLLWRDREVRLEFAICNCYLHLHDYILAIDSLERVLAKMPHNAALVSAIGRVHLNLGDVKRAQERFMQAAELLGEGAQDSPMFLTNQGFLSLAKGAYEVAHKCFLRVATLEPDNRAAVNNAGVCALYKGDLQDAVTFLQDKLSQLSGVNESIVFNMCTLYELESNKANAKKKALIPLIMERGWDDYSVESLKL